ncbi:hypothetical protein [Brevibacillus panacihumi]|uniref:Uncharacterized protein n=1 Tax=Brevibacillus panacihumi TaxID=497735 RepID=A0A3M8CYI3_9BACL|nr:hypothetical protein [Brevibacillus panacihumi]RNB80763.1 hypothetical protein EDM58_07920 [Brevibacillus panacihumi]
MGYTFKKLTHDLSIGHEIEFIYADRKFSITNTPSGWCLAEYYKDEIQVYSSHLELLQHGSIDGKALRNIWPLVAVDAIF